MATKHILYPLVSGGGGGAALSDTAPVDITKDTAAAGSADEAARQDHKHDIATAAAGSATPGDSAAEGSSTSLARADHQHALPAFGASSGTFCEGDDSRLSDARAPTGAAGGQLSGTYPNPSVAGLTETAGPTALAVGAIADGQLLARSGASVAGLARSGVDTGAVHVATAAEIAAVTEKATLVGDDLVLIEDSAASNVKKRAKVSAIAALAAGGGDALEIAKAILIAEEFPRNGSSSNTGNHPWGTAGTVDSDVAVEGRFGVTRITAPVGGNRAFVNYSSAAAQSFGYLGDEALFWESDICPQTTVDAGDVNFLYCGFASGNTTSGSAGANWTNGVCFELNPSSGRWEGQCKDGGTATTVSDAGAAAPAVDTWAKLRWVYTPGGTPQVEFFVDGVSIGVVTTNLPTAVLNPIFRVTSDAGAVAAPGLLVDNCYLLRGYTP